MEEQCTFLFPVLTITEVWPIVSRGERVFAFGIKALTNTGTLLQLYENRGLDLTGCIGKKMEFLLEITKGEFEYRDNAGNPPGNVCRFQYEWSKRLYEYFPELVVIKDRHDAADETKENSIQGLFERSTSKLYGNWGLNGIQIGVYQDKPMLHSVDGLFLLNEFQFEDEIEDLELNDEVFINIEEVYVRGIRPCILNEELVTNSKGSVNSKSKRKTGVSTEPNKTRFKFYVD